MTALTISSNKISQLDSLYSLNDLHRAAGGDAKYQPSRFIRSSATQRLIAEISNYPDMGSLTLGDSPVIKTEEGKHGGTYVCRELVYAYAMWISGEFYLKVIRSYDEIARKATPQPLLPTDKKAAKEAWALFYSIVKENKRAGMDDISAWMIAGTATKDATGANLLEHMGNPHLGREAAMLLARPEDFERVPGEKEMQGKMLDTAQRMALRLAVKEVTKAAPDKYPFQFMVSNWLAEFMDVSCEERIPQHRFVEALSILRMKAECERAS